MMKANIANLMQQNKPLHICLVPMLPLNYRSDTERLACHIPYRFGNLLNNRTYQHFPGGLL